MTVLESSRYSDRPVIGAIIISLFAQMQAISLLGVALPLAMISDGVGTRHIGLAMGFYSIGLVLDSTQGKKLIGRIGHIRAYGVFAAIGTIAAIAHGFSAHPVLTACLRLLSGFSAALMLVVIESWLNSFVHRPKAKLMAWHQFTFFLAMGSGQLWLGLVDGDVLRAYWIAAILLCAAVLPIALVPRTSPVLPDIGSLPVGQVLRRAPAGVLGAFMAGTCIGALYNLTPVYSSESGYDAVQTSHIMSVMLFSGILLQRPVAWLARRVASLCLLPSIILSVAAVSWLIVTGPLPLAAAALCIGSLIAVIYPVSSAMTHESLGASQAVQSSVTLMMAYAVGGISAPILVGQLMQQWGVHWLFHYLTGMGAGLAILVWAIGRWQRA